MDFVSLWIFLAFILASSVLHEFMHGYAAFLLGDDTAKVNGRLSFNPIKHLDPFLSIILPVMIVITNMLSGVIMPIFGGAKPVPFNPNNVKHGEWGVAIVAAAGPLTNLVLAFILTGVFCLVPNELAAQIAQIGIMVNMGFFAFNVIPIPPLDGSRIIFAIAPDFIRKIMAQMERFGLMLVFIIVIFFSDQIFGIIQGITGAFIKFFVSIFT